jgi:hypothetical protein
MSQVNENNLSSNAANTLTDLNYKSEKKRKGKDKTRKSDDNVSEAQFGTANGKSDKDSDLPATKKRRRQRDKLNNKDDVTEGTIGEVDKKKKRRRHKEEQTDFGTNPTQKDFL